MRAVLTLFLALISAPFLINSFTIWSWLFLAARYNGVSPHYQPWMIFLKYNKNNNDNNNSSSSSNNNIVIIIS